MEIGRTTKNVADFKGSGFLAFDANGIDRIDDFHPGLGAEFAHEAQGVVKIARAGR